MCLEYKCTYRSILRAHRLRTVIPTEAFWMNGINLHTYTPNGQSSAISCKRKTMETDKTFVIRETWTDLFEVHIVVMSSIITLSAQAKSNNTVLLLLTLNVVLQGVLK